MKHLRFVAPFAEWLGRECWVRVKGGNWEHCRVVAVSHKGGVCVRPIADKSGHNGKWIEKKYVPYNVRWEG